MRSASAASLVTHMPASPNAPRFLVGKNDRQPTSPKLPARLAVASAAPMAWAASSMTFSPWLRARSMSAVMSATCPYRCTGMMARTRAPLARWVRSLPRRSHCRARKAATAAGLRLNVTGSMSQNNGRAPVRAMVPAVAKNVNGLVMTASPGPMPSAMSASSSASVPDDTPIP